MKALLLEGEKVGDPVHSPCYRELLEGFHGVLGVCDGRVVEFKEFDGSLSGRGPGLWRPLSLALAPSGRKMGAGGLFAELPKASVGAVGGGPGSTPGGVPRCT